MIKQLIKKYKYLFGSLSIVVVIGIVVLVLTNRTVLPPKSKHAVLGTSTAIIQITKNGFIPSTLAVSVGTRVVWINEDAAPHLPASDPYPEHNMLPSMSAPKALGQKEAFSYVFTKTAIVHYDDDLNPTLTGTIEVR